MRPAMFHLSRIVFKQIRGAVIYIDPWAVWIKRFVLLALFLLVLVDKAVDRICLCLKLTITLSKFRKRIKKETSRILGRESPSL